MTELVHEVGYPRVTIRRLVTRARVTKPTFYRLFSSKEDCFYAAYDCAVGDAIRWTAGATEGSTDRRDLITRGLGAFCTAFANRPAAASLAIMESMSLGDNARERLHRTEDQFAELIRRRFGELDTPVDLPFVVALGLVTGIARVARRRLDFDQPQRFEGDAGELATWAVALTDVEALRAFMRSLHGDQVKASVGTRTGPPAISGDDDRAVLVNATTRLVAEQGYKGLALADILALSGVPRRRFDAQFGSVEECFTATVELGTLAMIAEARAAYSAGPAGPLGIARAIDALTRYLASNPGVARLLFIEVLVPGRNITRQGAGLLSTFAGLLQKDIPIDGTPSDQSAEASVGAIWALLRHEIAQGRATDLSRLSPILMWFALAPSLDEDGLLLVAQG